jgi:hypothetical protein
MGAHIDWAGDYDLARERLADALPRMLGMRIQLNPQRLDYERDDRPVFQNERGRAERDRGFKSEEAA